MEHTNKKEKLKFRQSIEIAWVVAIFLMIIALFSAVVVLSKNIDIIKEGPINYELEHNDNIDYCNCYDIYGTKTQFPNTKEEIKIGTGKDNIIFGEE